MQSHHLVKKTIWSGTGEYMGGGNEWNVFGGLEIQFAEIKVLL